MLWSYIFLGVAIVAEVAATSLLKLSDGFTKIGIGVGSLALYVVSLAFLSQATKLIPVSIAYALWSGFGIALIVGVSFFFLKEQLSLLQLVDILLILVGAVVLNSGTSH